jgi:hypothetical protein
MRPNLLIIGLGLLATALGCNSDPRCRRETALLRAEILDLEDKYFITRAQRDEALAALHGQGKSGIAAKIDRRTRPDPIPQLHSIDEGETMDAAEPFFPSTRIDEDSPGIHSDWEMEESFEGIDDRFAPPTNPAPNPVTPSGGTARPAPSGSSFRQAKPHDSILLDLEDGSSFASGRKQPGDLRLRDQSPAAPTGRAASAATPASNRASSNAVAQVLIDKSQTFIQTNEAGAQDLVLFLRMKGSSGEPLLSLGSLTVSLIDPNATTAQQRLGIWKFLPEEIELFFVNANAASGILLSLPLDTEISPGKEIAVLIRFQTLDGRALEATTRVATKGYQSLRDSPPSNAAADDLVADRTSTSHDRGVQGKIATPNSSSAPVWRPVR